MSHSFWIPAIVEKFALLFPGVGTPVDNSCSRAAVISVWPRFLFVICNLAFGGLGVACWPLVHKFTGSNLAEAVRFLGRKNPQHAFLRRGSKAVGPMLWICSMQKIPKFMWKSEFRQNYRTISRPQFHVSLLGSFTLWMYRHLAAKVGTSKGRGKQWQTTPKNLPRMQCARAIPVTWLGSGSCQPGL